MNTLLQPVLLIQENAHLLSQGVINTLTLAILGNGIALVLGLFICFFRLQCLSLSPRFVQKGLSWLAYGWIYVFRNLPLLIQVLIFYYGLQLPGYWATLLGLCTYTSAFMAETFRAGFNTVCPEEKQQARRLGLSSLHQLTLIYLPRSLESNTPALASQMMNLTKNTAIGYFVAVSEMTYTFEALSSQTYHFALFFTLALATYVALCALIHGASQRVESRLRARFFTTPLALKGVVCV
jgi:His/Glu/Gln/Arg/opine family amino acid ABC transporter permease subunit